MPTTSKKPSNVYDAKVICPTCGTDISPETFNNVSFVTGNAFNFVCPVCHAGCWIRESVETTKRYWLWANYEEQRFYLATLYILLVLMFVLSMAAY